MPTADGPLKNLVVVENHLVDSLSANPAFQREFPFLASLVQPRPVKPGCQRCRKKQRATLAAYRAFKNTLAAMEPRDKIRFKNFLDCKQVQVVHVNAANRIINRTF